MANKNKTKKFSFFLNGKFDYSILIVTLLLLSMGLIMLLSASAPKSFSENGNSYEYIMKQGLVAGVGLVLMIALSKIEYRIYRRLKWVIYIGFVVLLIVVGFVASLIGILFALRIEQVAGYYQCNKCYHRYIPTYSRVLWAPHINRTRDMKCP